MDNDLMRELAFKYSDRVLQPFDTMLNEMGFDALCKLSDVFGGSTLYIPTKKRIFGACFAEEMKNEFNGGNYRDIAKKYEVCERTVRYIISSSKWKKP